MPKKRLQTRLDFLSPLSVIPGFGGKRVTACVESGIETVGDLLYYFPRRYIDRSNVTKVKDIGGYVNQSCTVVGTISRTRLEKGRRPRLRIQLTDDTGAMEALWFQGVAYFRKSLHTGMRVVLTGKVGYFGNFQMVHPMLETIGEGKDCPDIAFVPQYRITVAMKEAGIGQKTLLKAIRWLIRNVKHYPRVLPRHIEEKKGFPTLEECIAKLHLPGNPEQLDIHRSRIRYQELYVLALTLRWNRRKYALPGKPMQAADHVDRFRAALPFTLTESQEEAARVLLADAGSEQRMHRLLQGDVGSGKTVVAFATCLAALREGYQVAWLAPTEILALQTMKVVGEWLRTFDLEAGLLTGGQGSRERRELLGRLADGSLRFVVGTHALLQPSVTFSRLGMIVIDEQHRFGVNQRLKLQEKAPSSDFLLMSATPIPQTLAQTLYGDLGVVTIHGIPPGRHRVATHVVPEHKRADMEKFVVEQVKSHGAQVYYVVPRIESDDDEETGLKNAQSTFRELTRGAFSSLSCAFIHGRMTAEEKQRTMDGFASGEISVLVATTVVEVGIDAPDAAIMVVENAERFGLSQLHQLRGRVGRGDKKSYCFLLAQPTDNGLAQERLMSLCRHHDGFRLAEMDLKLRGPGEVAGVRQSGWEDLRMANILDDIELFSEVQQEVEHIFST